MSIQELQTSRLDINNNYSVDATCKQLDNIVLRIVVYDKSIPADLSNYSVRLRAFKSDQVPLIQNTDIAIQDNLVTIIANEQLTITSGIVKAELQFINKTTLEKKSTFYLNINVVASVLETDIGISAATCTLLKELDNKLDQVENIGSVLIEAVEINNELKDTSIPAANIANSNLESSIDTANTTKVALDQANTNADNSKSTLDISITNANNSKSALDTSKTNADNSKVALDESIAAANNFAEAHENIENLVQQVNQNTEQMSNIMQHKIKWNPSIKGMNVLLGSPGVAEKTLAQVETIAQNVKDISATHVLLIDFFSVATGNVITQYHTSSYLQSVIDIFKAKGITVTGFKLHYRGTIDTANLSTFFTNYQTFINTFISLCTSNNIEYIGLTNECPDLNGADSVTYWTSIINTIHAAGLKVFISMTHYGSTYAAIYDLIDVIGFNFYPWISFNDINTTFEEGISSWKEMDGHGQQYCDYIKYIKTKYNKPIWITETGCTDYQGALASPFDYINVTSNPLSSGKIQSFYLDISLNALGDNDFLDGVFIWDAATSDDIFTPFANQLSIDVVKKYWMEV